MVLRRQALLLSIRKVWVVECQPPQDSEGLGGFIGAPQKYAQPRFYLVVLGTRAQNSFTSVDIQGHGVVTSAGADGYGTITNGSTVRTFWRWNITPTGWDGTGTSTVTIS